MQWQRVANRVAVGLVPECLTGPTEDANLRFILWTRNDSAIIIFNNMRR